MSCFIVLSKANGNDFFYFFLIVHDKITYSALTIGYLAIGLDDISKVHNLLTDIVQPFADANPFVPYTLIERGLSGKAPLHRLRRLGYVFEDLNGNRLDSEHLQWIDQLQQGYDFDIVLRYSERDN